MRNMLRIGISCYPTYGGSGIVATEIGTAMAERGHKVHFMCSEVPRRLNQFQDNIYFHEVETHDYPLFIHPQYPLSLASKMIEVTEFENLDILHAHYAVPHATSAYLARQALGTKAPKIITTLHGTDITLIGKNRSYLPIVRFSILESDGITAPSCYLKNATYDKINISTNKPIEVIPNFVDSNIFNPQQDDQVSPLAVIRECSHDGKKIIHVSNFRPVKRVGDVIKVFERVLRKTHAHLILIGDGPDRSNVEREVHDKGLSDNVCFLGKQISFANILRDCHVFLLPSESESFGLAALEALSCGVPVVASKIAGIPEVISHGETGLLSEVGDVDNMASDVLHILNDTQLHKRMSSAARERAITMFNRDKIIDQYEAYYYQVMERT